MNNEPLAPVFLDNKAITIKDPKPKVSDILSAGGRDGDGVTQVRWMKRESAPGTLLRTDHTLDRTSEPTTPIYLTSVANKTVATPAANPIVDEEITVRADEGNDEASSDAETSGSDEDAAESSDEATGKMDDDGSDEGPMADKSGE